jgi:tRNA-Thr(GGU) m(6)t(6)A37 methyltransferase TsaA
METAKPQLENIKTRKFPKEVCFKPIGIIHSPFKSLINVPRQSWLSNAEGKIEIFEEFQKGLKFLDGFSHIYCIYFFDLIKSPLPLQSKSYLGGEKKGVFAIRTPFRPNPIGLSIFKNMGIKENIVKVKGLDTLDRTPVLDIKPMCLNLRFGMMQKMVGYIKPIYNESNYWESLK